MRIVGGWSCLVQDSGFPVDCGRETCVAGFRRRGVEKLCKEAAAAQDLEDVLQAWLWQWVGVGWGGAMGALPWLRLGDKQVVPATDELR